MAPPPVATRATFKGKSGIDFVSEAHRKHEGEFRERNPRETPTPREANLPSRESSTGTPTTILAAVPTTSNASLPLEPAVESKFYVLNGEGISPKATSSSRWKITHISDILHETGSFIPFMSITETWLKGYITDS